MIRSKSELEDYLSADKRALGHSGRHPALIGNNRWKFERALRYAEYYQNTKRGFLFRYLWLFRYYRLSVKLGIQIPLNVCGKGLCIHHYGLIVVNGNARIGDYCTFQQGVNIGNNLWDQEAPEIGNYVMIGPGAKIHGRIKIADGVVIGAGAIVTHSFEEENIIIAGNPAKVIRGMTDEEIKEVRSKSDKV